MLMFDGMRSCRSDSGKPSATTVTSKAPRSRPAGSVSHRITKDLEQLDSFLEDVEARSASVQQTSFQLHRNRQTGSERVMSEVECTADDNRLNGSEEQLAEEKPTKSSETPGTDYGPKALQELGITSEVRFSAEINPNETSQKRMEQADGNGGEISRDNGYLREADKVDVDVRGIANVREFSRGRNKDSGESKGPRNEPITIGNENPGLRRV